MSGEGINSNFSSTFYAFTILSLKLKKMKLKTAEMSHSLEILDYHALLLCS